MFKLRFFFLGVVATLLILAPVGSAQIISELSGNGQLICPLCPNGIGQFAPMIVIVKDLNGNPLPNQTVTWTVTSGNGFVNQATTVTAASGTLADGVTPAIGTSSNVVVVSTPLITQFGQSYAQATVNASVGTSSVNFTETQGLTAQGGVQQVFASLVSPPLGTSFSGSTGSSLGTPVTVTVSSLVGGGIPGVELKVVAPDPTKSASVSCQGPPGLAPNTVVTDATGTATCNLIYTGLVGSAQFSVLVGGQYSFPASGGYNFTVTAGTPATMRIISGNNQSANPGAALPGALIAEVDDASGTPLPGQSVIWSVAQGNATLSQQTTTTDSTGRVQTSATLAAGSGPVQIRVALASNSGISATFSETVNVSITGLSKLSGDTQSAMVNQAFSQPLVVQVNAQPSQGVGVTFAVTSGNATVATPNASSNAGGQASTTIQAGANAGPVVVTATAGAFSVTFNLTVTPLGPSITSNSFYNAAGLQQGSLSPCSLATIVASGLAPGIQGAVVPGLFGPLPYLLANVSVKIGNSYSPIFSVMNNYTPGQDAVTFQVPCEVTPGTVQAIVTVGGGSATVTLQIGTVSPGVFLTVMSDGVKRAVLTRQDGSFVELENPARAGEIIRAYVTGLGPVTPAVGTNQIGIAETEMDVTSSVVVGVNNAGVRVVDAKYAPGLIGVYVVDFQLPSDVATGNNIPFAVAVQQGGNLVFGNGTSLPIH